PNSPPTAAPTANAPTPAAAHVSRYPPTKAIGAIGERCLVIRAYSAAVGATDGNIIAAIITTHTETNQPNAPRCVHGPSSMPRIRSAVHHHPIPAVPKRTATSPR